jgi:DNA-binding beta-propeller fold protein YncE
MGEREQAKETGSRARERRLMACAGSHSSSWRRAALAICCALVGSLALASTATAFASYENECPALTTTFCTAGAFGHGLGVAVDNSAAPSHGDVYVVELEPKPELIQLNAEGTETGTTMPGLSVPLYDAVDSSSDATAGDVYVSEYGHPGHVAKFKPNGELETGFGSGGRIEATYAAGVAVDPKTGELFVAERGPGKIAVYTSAGAPATETPFSDAFTGSGNPNTIAVDKEGNVYVAYENPFEVAEFPVGKRETPEVIDADRAHAVTLDNSTSPVHIFISQSESANEGVVYEAGNPMPIERFGKGELGSVPYGIGVNEEKHWAYVDDYNEAAGGIFGPSGPPKLTVEELGRGSGVVTSTPPGINCPTECKAEFTENEVVTLKAAPNAGSEFGGWEGCDSNPTTEECTVKMTTSRTVKAKFDLQKFKLTVKESTEGKVVGSEGAAGLTCGTGAECEVMVEEGATVKLSATGNPGSFTFNEWTGEECIGLKSAECEFTMPKAPVTETAVYVPSHESPLTVVVIGKGEVNSTSPNANINKCTETTGTCSHEFEGSVTLEEHPDPKSVFAGWIGPCKHLTPTTCDVEVNAAREVYAVFLLEGVQGEPGPPGPEGKQGLPGESPVITFREFPGGEEKCTSGGVEIKVTLGGVTEKAIVCKGKEGKEGKAATGKEGSPGKEGPAGKEGKEGPAGKEGKEGPAGKVVLVTCTKKGRKKHCTTKTVTGSVSVTTSGLPARAMLSRHGAVYAAGTAREAGGRLSLRLSPLRALRPGRYTLTLISGSGRDERIRSGSFTLR